MPRIKNELASWWGDLKNTVEALRPNRHVRQRRGLPTYGASADYHLRSDTDFLKVVELARDFDINDAIVGQMVTRAVDNILQDGFTMDPDTPDPELNQFLKADWNEWSSTPELCDVSGEDTFHEMTWISTRAMFIDGDALQVYTDLDAYQLFEAHELRTPNKTKRNVVNGVRLDGQRKPLEYWIAKSSIDPWKSNLRVDDVEKFPTRDGDGFRVVNHIRDRKRGSQTRGWSVFLPIFDLLSLYDDIEFADLVHRQIQSCFIVFRKKPVDWSGNFGPNAAAGEETQTSPTGTQRTMKNIGPGTEVVGEPGEEFELAGPKLPPAETAAVKRCLQLVSVNIGMPLILTMLDPSETNFSGYRGAVDQARLGWRRKQKIIENRSYRPAYDLRVERLISRGGRAAQLAKSLTYADLYRVKCHRPKWPYIEPTKDSTSRKIRVGTYQTSPQRAAEEAGDDWDELKAEIVANRGELIRAAELEAQQINDQLKPEPPVTWRDVLEVIP